MEVEQTVDQYLFTILGLLLDYRNFVIGPFTFGLCSLFELRLIFNRVHELMALSEGAVKAISLENQTEMKEEEIFVKMKNLCCSYSGLEDEQLLHNINLDRNKMGLNVIIGPSGSGN